MAVAERAHAAQLTIAEMGDVIDQAKHELMRLENRTRHLERIVELARAALEHETTPPAERIAHAMRFLRVGFVQ